jgi:hypothetical protein
MEPIRFASWLISRLASRAGEGARSADRFDDASAYGFGVVFPRPEPVPGGGSRMTANSSPPTRATVSEERTALVSRRAVVRRSSSPAACPRVSLTFLKLSGDEHDRDDDDDVGSGADHGQPELGRRCGVGARHRV